MSEVMGLMREDGSIDEDHLSLIPGEDLLRLLKLMIYNRIFDERMLLLQRQGRLGFYLTSTGEEAATFGAAYPLCVDDPIFISYRELGSLFWRGVPPEMILNQLIGNDKDPSKGRQLPVHYAYKEYHIPSVSSPVGTQIPHACGAAYAYQLRGTGQVTLAFFGEGTASTGEFHAGLNFSGTLKAPVVFILRNNGYSISTPEAYQSKASNLAKRAEGYGIHGEQIDGNDIFAVVKSVREAAERARNGEGPSLIEMQTYRLGAHSSSDEPSKYRSSQEEEDWKHFDGLTRLQRHVNWRGLWDDEQRQQHEQEVDASISKLIKAAAPWPPPPVPSLFDDVYEAMPKHLEQQKDNYLSFLRHQEENHG